MTLPNRENYVVRPRPKMVQQMLPPPVSEYRPTFVPPQDHIPPMSTMHVHFSPPAAQTQVTTTSSSAGSAAQPIHVPETAEDRTQYTPETHGETKLNFSKLSELFPLAGTSKVTTSIWYNYLQFFVLDEGFKWIFGRSWDFRWWEINQFPRWPENRG